MPAGLRPRCQSHGPLKGEVIRVTKSKNGSASLQSLVSTYRDKKLSIHHTASRTVTVILRTAFLVGMCFVMLYPVIFMVSSGFKTLQDVYDPTVVWLPKHWTLESLKIAFDVMDYTNGVIKTLVTAIPSVQTYIIPLFSLFKNFDYFGIGSLIGLFTGKAVTTNLLNNPLVFYLQAALGMGIRSGLYIFMLRQFYRGFPTELEEAAMIDGCGPMRTFLRIMLPNATSMIVTVMLFSLVWYWND